MEEFVRNRITQLRLERGLSEYQLSYDLGHSRGYIYNISSGKAMPSMSEFFSICDYFDITPQEFFDTEHDEPQALSSVIDDLKSLRDSDIAIIGSMIDRMKK